MLVLLGDVMSSAYQQAQLKMGIFSPKTVSVGDLFVGALLFMTIIGIPLAWLVWLGAWVWKAYRLLRGFLDLDKNRAMPV